MSIDWYFDEIKKRYGNVTRTRGLYLYTEKGVRLVDMYLDAGHSIMGRGNGSGKSILMFKNAIAKGLTSNFESGRKHRAAKAILKSINLLSENKGFENVHFFSSKESCAYAICKALNIDFSFDDIHTNSMDSWLYKNGVPIWKPLSNDDISDNTLCYVVPAFLLSQNIHIVVTKESKKSESPCDIPQCTLEGLARSFYDYEKEKACVSEKDFCIFDDAFNTYFKRSACYLFPTIDEKDYKDFVIHCIDKGLLLSPYYNVPSIVPYTVNAGDIKKLTQSPFIAEK